MSKNSTAASNVIPFRFEAREAREIRTMLIDGEPWFVASDISSALQYRDAFNMIRNLDDDERGTQIVSTPSGDQEMTIINESGLYSAILRSRKAEAKKSLKSGSPPRCFRASAKLAPTFISQQCGQLLRKSIGTRHIEQ